MDNIPESRLLEVLDVVCENVGPDWREFAQRLGLTDVEISSIVKSSDPSVPSEQCWTALCKWREKTPRGKVIRELTYALDQCRQKRVSDLVHKLMSTPQSVDQILSPHVDREDKMLEAMYIIVDVEATHWRHIAKHLGLNDQDIVRLQKQFGDRTREKCMHALYKWRHMVPLHEYKVANLVMALRATGLDHVAGLVKNLGTNDVSYRIRKPVIDEIFIHLEIKHIDVETYTPTPNSTPRGDPTPKPKNSLPVETLNSYVINKALFHLLDRLDSQEKYGAHPLVVYLQNECQCSEISEVNRRSAYIAVKCKNRSGVDVVKAKVTGGELSTILTESLLTTVIKKEVGLADAKICAVIH